MKIKYVPLFIISFVALLGITIGVIVPFINEICQNHYGTSYNIDRRILRIPIIPLDWHIKERDASFIWWTGKEDVIGHKRKSVTFSGCKIKAEYDVFNLPKENGKSRWLEIDYFYKQKNKNPSFCFKYQIDNSAIYISENEADSILKANKINRYE